VRWALRLCRQDILGRMKQPSVEGEVASGALTQPKDGRQGTIAGNEPLGIVGRNPKTSSGRNFDNCIILRVGENDVVDRVIGYGDALQTLADLPPEPVSPSIIVGLVSKRCVDEVTPLVRRRSTAIETAKLLKQMSVWKRMHGDPVGGRR